MEARGEPHTLLDEDEKAAVSKLTPDDVAVIDKALLAECAPAWRKVARVAGYAMKALENRLGDLPYGYFAQRVQALVIDRALESQGNLDYTRTSEVRLPRRSWSRVR